MLGDRARVTSFYQSCLPRLIVVLEKNTEVTAHERCFGDGATCDMLSP